MRQFFGERLAHPWEELITQKLMIPEKEIEAENPSETTGPLPSDGASCCASLGDFACGVCGSPPDNDGTIQHGLGCYTQNPSGGGTSFVQLPPGITGQSIHDPTPIHKLINCLNRKCVEAAKAGDLIGAVRLAGLSGKVEEARFEIWHNV